MLEQSFRLQNGFILPNRVVFQPMEGCDCHEDGSPSALTREKYFRNVKSGAGLIWFEANAVCPEGRTNARQLMLTRKNLPVFQRFIEELRETAERENGYQSAFILQLTHSGRQSIMPMIAYRHPIYEETRPVTDNNVVTDEYLDTLADRYAESARLAREAGFDGVDVKSCHGYLLQELLSAFTREGRYGGEAENRFRLLYQAFEAVKAVSPVEFLVTSRLGLCDMVPKPYGFGTTEENGEDLTEPFALLEGLKARGLSLVNVTIGNPYYNPHVNRPFRRGPYVPQESAEEGLSRFERIERAVKERFPDLAVIGSGLSYYRENLIARAEEQLQSGVCDLVGFGRECLAYPEFYRDALAGSFSAKKCCLACSKCTELMRAKQVAGCAVFNEYYRNLYRETVAKKGE